MAAVALMMIIIQILCVYIPATALVMINANFDERNIDLAGSIDEVGTECAAILRQIFKKNKQSWGALGAQGVLVNIFMLALTGQIDEKQLKINWKLKEDMFKKQEIDSALVTKLREKAEQDGFFMDKNGHKIDVEYQDKTQSSNIKPISSEQIKQILKSES